MSNRIFSINAILVVFVAVEAFMVIQLWTSMDNVKLPGKSSSAKIKGFEIQKINDKHVLPLSAYVDITKLNLFSEERTEYKQETPDVEPEQEQKNERPIEALKTNKIILFGVVVMGESRKALVSDVENKSNRDSIWIEKGETLDGFLVDAIEKDRIVVSNKGKKYSVLLYDDKNPKKRKPVQTSKADNNKAAGNKKVQAPKPPVPAKKNNSAKKVSEEEYEILSTPFGDFKRKKQK